MHKTRNLALLFGALAATVWSGALSAARADDVAEFYRGKSVTLLIGVGAGGEYDLHARMLARYMKKYIPGNPAVLAQNMTGAGGLTMANFLYNLAPKDGTVFGILPNTFPTMQAVGFAGIQFDSAAFQWIGSIIPTVETMVAWKTTGATTIADARRSEIIAGASGRGAMTYTFAALLNEVAGTKFKIVLGYSGGNDINLAMERGEVGARNSTWSNWKSAKADWLKNRDISVLAYAGPRPADLPGVPSVEDLAVNPEDKVLVKLVVGAGAELGHPFAAPPGAPPERIEALIAAFEATMKDTEFLREAAAISLDVEPVHGKDMRKVVDEVLAAPASIKSRAKALLE